MHHVEAHVAGTHPPDDGVGVGAVIVELYPDRMRPVGHLPDAGFKDPEGVGVGEHYRRNMAPQNGAVGLEIDLAVGAGRHLHDVVANHGSGRRVGSVGAVGNHHHAPLRPLAVRLVEGPNHQHPRQLAMRPGGGLQAHGVHSGELLQ